MTLCTYNGDRVHETKKFGYKSVFPRRKGFERKMSPKLVLSKKRIRRAMSPRVIDPGDNGCRRLNPISKAFERQSAVQI